MDRSNQNCQIFPPQGRASACALFLLFLIAPPLFPAQSATTPSAATIKVDVNLVVLHVIVRTRSGAFVTDLPEESFHVFEDGRPQSIRLFENRDIPVTVGLIVDSSGSMRRKRHDVSAAALALVRSSNPRDELFIVNFSDRVSLGLPPTQLFSANAGELEEALNRVPASGRTALYDAVAAGLAHLNKGTHNKKVLIVISDGGDNSSSQTLDQVLPDAERSNVIIYTIGFLDEHTADQRPDVLKKMARITGGEAFFPNQTNQAVEICQSIAADIRHQYTIGYVPTDEKLDETWRAVKVTITAPHKGRLKVRTRSGYFASPVRQTPPLEL